MFSLFTWENYLNPDIVAKAESLYRRAQNERDSGHSIYPPQESIFRALELTPPEKVRVVIIGQDPYHTPGVANGLAFSVSPGVKIPPSLRNIFKELQSDLGYQEPASGDLTKWAEQGVLLLNTLLTVEQGRPASHVNWGWQDVVMEILRVCAYRLPQPVVFVLWGGQARTIAAGLQLSRQQNRASVYSSHPSPLGARKGSEAVPAFIGSRPFSKVNTLLQSMGAEPIDWQLT